MTSDGLTASTVSTKQTQLPRCILR